MESVSDGFMHNRKFSSVFRVSEAYQARLRKTFAVVLRELADKIGTQEACNVGMIFKFLKLDFFGVVGVDY